MDLLYRLGLGGGVMVGPGWLWLAVVGLVGDAW